MQYPQFGCADSKNRIFRERQGGETDQKVISKIGTPAFAGFQVRQIFKFALGTSPEAELTLYLCRVLTLLPYFLFFIFQTWRAGAKKNVERDDREVTFFSRSLIAPNKSLH